MESISIKLSGPDYDLLFRRFENFVVAHRFYLRGAISLGTLDYYEFAWLEKFDNPTLINKLVQHFFIRNYSINHDVSEFVTTEKDNLIAYFLNEAVIPAPVVNIQRKKIRRPNRKGKGSKLRAALSRLTKRQYQNQSVEAHIVLEEVEELMFSNCDHNENEFASAISSEEPFDLGLNDATVEIVVTEEAQSQSLIASCALGELDDSILENPHLRSTLYNKLTPNLPVRGEEFGGRYCSFATKDCRHDSRYRSRTPVFPVVIYAGDSDLEIIARYLKRPILVGLRALDYRILLTNHLPDLQYGSISIIITRRGEQYQGFTNIVPVCNGDNLPLAVERVVNQAISAPFV